MISLKDIERPFKNRSNEQCYLRDINANVQSGEIIAVIGRPGSGKTTLLRCINLLEKPLTGIVAIDKKNLTILTEKQLRETRQSIAMIPQQIGLLASKTVWANVALPLLLQNKPKEIITKTVDNALSLTGISEKAISFPGQLNNSQKIRVALARALATKPKILLCDNITAGLDNKSIQSLLQILKQVHLESKTTMILITHDIEVIKVLAQRVFVMHQGEIIEQCPALELFLHPESEVAKDFIKAATRSELPWAYRRKLRGQSFNNSHPIVRLAFVGCLSPESILSKIIDEFQLKISILQAHQENIQYKLINVIIIEAQGHPESVQNGLGFLQEHGLYAEILGYVTNPT